MDDLQLLKYGFVVPVSGKAIYDHYVRVNMKYADGVLTQLMSSKYPVIANRILITNEEGVSSPVFKYQHKNTALDCFQSAYYLLDALTRKGMLPVYFPSSGEVKNLMPLLNDSDRQDAALVIQILRKRYVNAKHRKPRRAFMIKPERSAFADANTVNMSDAEILKIFGRLPQDNVHELNYEYPVGSRPDGRSRWA